MRFKILIVIGLLAILLGHVAATANTKDNGETKSGLSSAIGDLKEIKVAILVDDTTYKNQRFGGTNCFMRALGDYSWKVGVSTYSFIPTYFPMKNLLRGYLTTENFDVLIYPPNTADEFLLNTGFSRLPKNKIRVREISDFVKNGGGYFGTCGGALIAGNMENKPDSFLERSMKNSCLGISCFNIQFNSSIPILNQMVGKNPETVDTQAYLFFSSWGGTTPHLGVSGAPLDCPISKDNPIFDDYMETTRRIRWIGAPAFQVPENPDREISVLAHFPSEEISDNESTQIHYWEYIGGIRGLIKGQLFGEGKIPWCENLGRLMKAFLFSKDWQRLDKVVKTDCSNQAFMTAEVYPNENKARIVRCSGHPEFMVWWGGHIGEVEDNDENRIYDGFYYWMNVTPFNETVEDEKTYNYWINRRSVAWAAKIPDNDLPPIYGPSQVSDIYPFEQSSKFTIEGNVKTADGRISLDLYYRYSNDNSSWSDWILYDTDNDDSDGWSWEFSAPELPAYYQFYSIRHVEYEGYTEIENAPPGPDTIVYVNNKN